MMKRMMTTLAMVVLVFSLLPVACAQDNQDTNVGAQLPPKLRGLLIQEMQAILKASEQIQAALVQGQHEIVAKQAQAIHDSFIMDQQMTPADEQALHDAVPEAFLQRDAAFHALSAKLAEAGRDRNTKRELQYFSDMVEACADCHSQYATARFPGLRKASGTLP